MNMNPNPGYLIYQAERPRSYAEQREADLLNGKLAASLARWSRMVRLPRRTRSGRSREAAAAGGGEPVLRGVVQTDGCAAFKMSMQKHQLPHMSRE